MQLYIKGHNPMHPMVHVRLPRDMVQAVDHLAIDRGTDRSETAAWLLRTALEAWQ
jgi:metal-responsive CopG/Arc/MetJ family transcriptional regulator